MITIAVDAMGGDHAPRTEVEGALLAARQLGIGVVLVGQEEMVRRELAKHSHRGLPVEIHHAAEVIGMGEEAARSFRKKRDSSIHVAARLVREGKAGGFVSAGNTGAVMTVARFLLGTLAGVDRPALAAPFPTSRGSVAVMVDVGANVDCKPEHLEQFAVMGEAYYRSIFNVTRPKVGLLSIGEEEVKGNELVKETHSRMKHLPVNFVGNVEGRDVFSGRVDVIVCDGFIGNVALKISEGMVEAFGGMLKEALSSTLSAKVGYVLSRQAFSNFKKRVDYSEYGGAPLLGLKGVCIICHGRSNANAIMNAVRVAAGFCERRVNERIEQGLAGTSRGRRDVATTSRT
ncbi:MAG TPA: phosphate acyltransferase PlsX [Candidatus Acidoferrales bacterium]